MMRGRQAGRRREWDGCGGDDAIVARGDDTVRAGLVWGDIEAEKDARRTEAVSAAPRMRRIQGGHGRR
jgi:hypothetical protein